MKTQITKRLLSSVLAFVMAFSAILVVPAVAMADESTQAQSELDAFFSNLPADYIPINRASILAARAGLSDRDLWVESAIAGWQMANPLMGPQSWIMLMPPDENIALISESKVEFRPAFDDGINIRFERIIFDVVCGDYPNCEHNYNTFEGIFGFAPPDGMEYIVWDIFVENNGVQLEFHQLAIFGELYVPLPPSNDNTLSGFDIHGFSATWLSGLNVWRVTLPESYSLLSIAADNFNIVPGVHIHEAARAHVINMESPNLWQILVFSESNAMSVHDVEIIGGNMSAPSTFEIEVTGGTPSAFEAEAGETITITADEAEEGYEFDEWVTTSPGVVFDDANAAETTFVMPANDVIITATYKEIPPVLPDTFEIEVTGGTPSAFEAEAGETITITADEAEEGYEFDEWQTASEGVVFDDANAAETTFVMPANDVIITATYKELPPVLPDTFTITVNDGTADFDEAEADEVITITANAAAEGYEFSHWSAQPNVEFYADNEPTTTFIMPANDITITANFKEIIVIQPDTFEVTVIGGFTDIYEAEAGEIITVTAVAPGEDYEFIRWESTPVVEFTTVNELVATFILPASDIEVRAIWEKVEEPALSDDASIHALTVLGVDAVQADGAWSVTLPFGTDLAELGRADLGITVHEQSMFFVWVDEDGKLLANEDGEYTITVFAGNGTRVDHNIVIEVAEEPAPVFGINIFNNGNSNNASLAAQGVINLPLLINGSGTQLPFSELTITAEYLDGTEVPIRIAAITAGPVEYREPVIGADDNEAVVVVNRIWNNPAGIPGSTVNQVQVRKLHDWDFINYSITWQGQTIEVLLVNDLYDTTHTVTFDPAGGTRLPGQAGGGQLVQRVREVAPTITPAVAPVLADREGFAFVGWDRELTGITEDTTITAVWSALPQLETPAGLNINNDTLTWVAVDNATHHRIYVDGVAALWTVPAPQDDFNLDLLGLEPGTYDIQVRALGNLSTHRHSELSAAIEFEIEEIPVVRHTVTFDLNGGNIDGNPGPIEVEVVEGEAADIADPTFALHIFDGWVNEHDQTVTLPLIAIEDITLIAQWTPYATLATPVVTIAEGIASWVLVADATSYVIYVDGEIAGNTDQLTFDLAGLALTWGTYQVEVRAITTAAGFLNSELSEAVGFVVPRPHELPVIGPHNAPTALQVNVAMEGYQFTVTGHPEPAFHLGINAPNGLAITADGLLHGTPTETGTYTFNVFATNVSGTNTVSHTITVWSAPQLSGAAVDGFVDALYDARQFTATGYPQPTLSVEGNLPPGLTFDIAAGMLSGTPNELGTFTFDVVASNEFATARLAQTVVISEEPIAPTITTEELPAGTVGSFYSYTVQTSGVPAPTIDIAGLLPAGLTTNGATISGIPTQGGIFHLTVVANNGVGEDDAVLTLVINAGTLPAPVNVRIEDGMVRWDAVDNAVNYHLFNNGISWLEVDVTQTLIDLSSPDWIGTNNITVVAHGDGDNWLDSPESLPYTFTISDDATLSGITVNGVEATQTDDGWAVELPYDTIVDEIIIVAVANDENAEVLSISEEGLEREIVVRAENGDEATHILTITIADAPVIPTFTVTFVLNNGSENIVVEVVEGEDAALPTGLTRSGYRFDRWDPANGHLNVTEDIEINAVWRLIEEETPVVTPPPATGGGGAPQGGSAAPADEDEEEIDEIDEVEDEEEPAGPVQAAGFQISFQDVTIEDWFYDFVMTVANEGLFQGVNGSQFDPNGEMTRAMFATVLARLAGVDLAAYADANATFTDVLPSDWYFTAIEWAYETGVVLGVGENMFDPNASVTREQIALMLYRFAGIEGIELPEIPQGTVGADGLPTQAAAFVDQDNISSWAAEAVDAIQAAGIVQGHPDGTFAPQDTATRAQVATIFARLLDVIE